MRSCFDQLNPNPSMCLSGNWCEQLNGHDDIIAPLNPEFDDLIFLGNCLQVALPSSRTIVRFCWPQHTGISSLFHDVLSSTPPPKNTSNSLVCLIMYVCSPPPLGTSSSSLLYGDIPTFWGCIDFALFYEQPYQKPSILDTPYNVLSTQVQLTQAMVALAFVIRATTTIWKPTAPRGPTFAQTN